jgi:hypothetical protein
MGSANVHREAIIQACARIASLRETVARYKEELKQAEAQLDRLLAGDSPQSVLPVITSPERENDRTLNQQIIDAIEVLAADVSAEEIAEALPGTNLTSIRSALPRLADAGKIQRAARGRYQSTKAPQRFAEAV